jgi:hypothetical protein
MVTAMARKTTKKKPGAKKTTTVAKTPAGPHSPDEVAFGQTFFSRVLPGMVAACPCPPDQENACYVHLGDGDRLDVAEILAAADRFVVLAVFDDGVGRDGVPRTDDDVGFEAVPYELVLRVSVRPAAKRGRFGFHFPHEALAAAAAAAAVPATNGAATAKNGGGKRRARKR